MKILMMLKPGGQGHVSKSGASSGPLTQPSQLIIMMRMRMNDDEDDNDDDTNSLFTPAALNQKVTLGGEVGEPRALRILPAKLL